MEKYDVVVVGGGVAGSVAARFAAKSGFRTLLVEKFKTPRNKPCSGIQFQYFEKLIGEKIPREKLCRNELFKVEIITPKDKVLKGRMKMLNFWRSTFDSWLNSLAADAGAEFHDNTSLIDFVADKTEGKIIVKLSAEGEHREVKAHYLIGADGMLSRVRKKLRPQDFDKKASGATVNYYFVGEANLDPNTLYMFYKREFCPLMFAWVYLKDDKWVIGTGANENPLEYADRFFNYVKEKYGLRGQIVKKEGFSSTLKSTVFLGEGRVLLLGDAAGLVDLYRGVGMDNAALSGRLAVKAITKAEEEGSEAAKAYEHHMKKFVKKIETNAKRQMKRLSSNNELERSLSPLNMLKGGLHMLIANQINKILPPEKLRFLPP
ncbi:MAG: NAD(P)/FAD-dependent oxidoreductase [Candidatus Bathyarchaeota archaeon]|jgi:geranylgeranyl reductase family protein|nr:NAD(P)/FAD-dependent oxidoreductase [Candidatus Bathyarchaeota archaeon A05DMB-3]MDH7607720.1 NAD(P)/FAD-dependent oxidoreductase [Candidatus Bathyarchaeota archaeon]